MFRVVYARNLPEKLVRLSLIHPDPDRDLIVVSKRLLIVKSVFEAMVVKQARKE